MDPSSARKKWKLEAVSTIYCPSSRQAPMIVARRELEWLSKALSTRESRPQFLNP